jgi:adenylosuccinate synthase
MEGWNENIGKAKQIEELPRNTRLYIERLQELAGTKLVLISVGSGRDETIILRNPFGD